MESFRFEDGQRILREQAPLNVDLASLQFQVHRVHKSGSFDSENAPIEFMILQHYSRGPADTVTRCFAGLMVSCASPSVSYPADTTNPVLLRQ
jgi:hypothetical protein